MICAPAIRGDMIDPILGADGKMHDSMSSYRHSLTPAGNPRGELYHEVGNEPVKPYKAPEFNEAQRVDDVKRALSDVKNNRVPPLYVVGENF